MKNSNNSSRMMLTELIFSIFFFMVVVAVCIQLFASAFISSKKSKELTMAVNICSGEADRFTACGRIRTPMYFNADGEVVDDMDDSAYALISDKLHTSGTVQSTTVSFIDTSDGEAIYSIEIKRRL